MKFDHINHVILFGGGDTLARFAMNLLKKKYRVEVVTAERRRDDVVKVDGKDINLLEFLKQKDIPVHFSSDVNSDKMVNKKITSNTMGFSVAAPWLFRKKFLDRFNGYILNHHGAPLPRFRGGGGMSWRILEDYRKGFNLIHQVDEGIDTGAILKVREFSYPAECREPQDYFKVSIEKEEEFLCLFLEDIKNGKDFSLIKQENNGSSYWPRLSTEYQGRINWNWSLKEIELFICAFGDPYKGASTMVNGEWVYLKKCTGDDSGGFHPFQVGIVYRKSQDSLTVALHDGSLMIGDVRDQRGESVIKKIRMGDRLYTPIKYLDEAMQFRAFYESDGLKKGKKK